MTVKIKERKEKERKVPIEVFPDPKTAVILTLQHSGAKNTPLVSVGDKVSIGQKIGDSDKKVNAPIHSPISGEVKQISNANSLCYEDVCTLPADFGEVMEAGQEIWHLAAERINLFLVLRSLPVGIFSLLTSILPVKNPLDLIREDERDLAIKAIESLKQDHLKER